MNIVSSDTAITIAFGVISTTITVIATVISYRTLKATVNGIGIQGAYCRFMLSYFISIHYYQYISSIFFGTNLQES